MKVLISPYSAKLPTGNNNPKNWPYFAQLVAALNEQGHTVVQIGATGEERIDGVGMFIQGWPLDRLKELEWDTFVSVDNFWPHYCYTEKLKGGVVVFGQSDPEIFGHPQNVNLLLSREHLRPYQFSHWFDVPYREEVFVGPEVVLEALHGRLGTAAVGSGD